MPDIIITPGSGLIDFYPSAKTASIFTSGNDLALSNPSGNFEIISGNLGINTTTPSGRLTVVGSGLFATRATPLSPTGTTTGIVPNALLHLYSSTSGDTVFNVEGTNGSLFSVVDNLSGVLMSVNNNAGLPVFEVYSDDKIIGGRFNQNDFVVSSGGSIGLGTATPSGKFDVRGSIFLIGSASNRFYIHNTGAATAFTYNSIYADNSDSLTLAGGSNSIALQGQGGRITIDAFSSEVDIGNSYDAGSANQYIRFTPANTEAVRITNSGNVGIGITAPSGKLHVVGTGIISSRLGIGTFSPNSQLHVDGSGYFASGCSITGILNVQVIKSPIASGTDGTGIITFDMNQANVHTLRLGGNRTLAVSNVSIGQRFTIRLKQDTSPPRTVTWFSGITWPQNRVPTLTRTANAVDVFSFISTASGKYDGFIVGYNFPNA